MVISWILHGLAALSRDYREVDVSRLAQQRPAAVRRDHSHAVSRAVSWRKKWLLPPQSLPLSRLGALAELLMVRGALQPNPTWRRQPPLPSLSARPSG